MPHPVPEEDVSGDTQGISVSIEWDGFTGPANQVQFSGKLGPVLRFWPDRGPDQFQPNTRRHIVIIIIQYRARDYY